MTIESFSEIPRERYGLREMYSLLFKTGTVGLERCYRLPGCTECRASVVSVQTAILLYRPDFGVCGRAVAT